MIAPDANGWITIEAAGPPEPEIDVLCWDGQRVFIDWFGSKPDCGCGVTHWQPLPGPPIA
jgi:hypothetical protein